VKVLRFVALGVFLLVAFGCVTLRPRDGYSPTSSQGYACKANCRELFDSCRNGARHDCNQTARAWGGPHAECTDNSLALGDNINFCIKEESDCLKVCQWEEDKAKKTGK